jgi:hypothetical protein
MTSSLLLALLALPGAEPPQVRLSADGQAVEVLGLASGDLAVLAKRPANDGEWPLLLAVRLDRKDSNELPPMLGSWRVAGDRLRFEPRYSLAPGVRYRVVLDPNRLPSGAGRKQPAIETVVSLPKPQTPPTKVVQVYPSSDVLPENQLRFYLHFSAPMSRGEAYRRVHLLGEDGKEVPTPFLELDEELWDGEGKRFTLFFDPGRVKRGLRPREDVGPTLIEGKRYTLVIDRDWQDANSNPLAEPYRKAFRAVAPVDAVVDPKTWKLTAPGVDTQAPLTLNFPRPLDNALARRLLTITDADGAPVAGMIDLTDAEKTWRFTPQRPWRSGNYQVVIDTRLEDLAGNNVARPFEVDVFRPVERQIKTETVTLPFRVGR